MLTGHWKNRGNADPVGQHRTATKSEWNRIESSGCQKWPSAIQEQTAPTDGAPA